MMPVLSIERLSVAIRRKGSDLTLVEDVSLEIAPGEALGLVGESGSGKSTTAFAVMGLFPSPSMRITAGAIRLGGDDLRALSPEQWRGVRGRRVGMVFQDPSTFLDPMMPVGRQVAEVLRAHRCAGDPRRRVAELLDMMELPDPVRTARKYPHELSGGQRQRVLIAAALAAGPDLLIADEPTSALDVTVQAGILDLLDRLRAELGLAMLLITHDLGVVAQRCQRVAVMYAGRVVETGAVGPLFARPRHPYTGGLLRSTLALEGLARDMFAIPGVAPRADAMPLGCRFHPRCPIGLPDPCIARAPPLMTRAGGGADACWRGEEAVAADPWGARG